MTTLESDEVFTASDVATFVVCPEAFRLKHSGHRTRLPSQTSDEAQRLRAAWIQTNELSAKLRNYTLYVYALFVMIVFMIFISKPQLATKFRQLRSLRSSDAVQNGVVATKDSIAIDPMVPTEILIVLLLLGISIVLWDLFDRRAKKLQQSAGFNEKSKVVSLRGSSTHTSRELYSKKLGLSARPQGMIKEEHSLIPIEVFPTAKKVQDRHVAQILVSLRLIEEEQQFPPPYGILRIGREGRSIQLRNTPEKQEWLMNILEFMKSVRKTNEARALPGYYKCRSCDLHQICNFSAYNSKQDEPEATAHESTPENTPEITK